MNIGIASCCPKEEWSAPDRGVMETRSSKHRGHPTAMKALQKVDLAQRGSLRRVSKGFFFFHLGPLSMSTSSDYDDVSTSINHACPALPGARMKQ